MTNRITLDLPAEFMALCQRDQVPPEQVLRCFIADLCSIQPYQDEGRTDGYCSRGSDERRLAGAYYDRAGYRFMREMDDEAQATNQQGTRPTGPG